MTVHFGDVPTWIGAIGSVIAVGGAIYAGLKGKAMLKVEQDRDEESREREIRSQANQIAGWTFPDPEESNGTGGSTFKMRVSAIVKNPSLQPIYNVVVLWQFGTQSLKTNKINLIAPEGHHTWGLPDQFLNYLGTSYSTEWKNNRQEAYELSENASELLKLTFSFTDTQGKRWQRDYRGTLTEVIIVPDTGGTGEVQEHGNQ